MIKTWAQLYDRLGRQPYICKNCKYFEKDLENDYLRGN